MSEPTGRGTPAVEAPHSIVDVARSAGVSSRTLRHYDAIGLLPATAVGEGGVRRYDDRALVRLQRILLLRGLGLGLERIRAVLDGEQDDVAALTAHVAWLERERDRIARQLAAVRTTIRRIEEGKTMSTDDTFDGFDQRRFRAEVEERWGADAWDRGQRWWGAKSADEQAAFRAEQRAIAADAAALAASGAGPDSGQGIALARRQFAWLAETTPVAELTEQRFRGLADLYETDDRFTSAYDATGTGAAHALAAAMRALADRGLPR